MPTARNRHSLKHIISEIGWWLAALCVAGLGLLLVATPSLAWWFPTAPTQLTSLTMPEGNLVFHPLAEAGQFLLSPLATITPTSTPMPTVLPTVAPTKTPKVVSPVVAPKAGSSYIYLPSPTVAATESTAEVMLDLVNTQRLANNLSPLKLNADLTKSAQAYAEQMQAQKFFSHTAPDGTTFNQRDQAAGYTGWTWLGENIASGQTSAQQVMTDWMNSPGHRANILDPRAKDLGVGLANGTTTYWVQEFGAQ